ncbi:MAG: hypothetical protein L0229_26445 [Blastocatellia bacterium]|nr:hypothetical protein [Blastocatellia bacterium]
MRWNKKIIFVLLILSLQAMGGDPRIKAVSRPASDDAKRIRFRVATIEEKAEGRNRISETLIEGPPGTDFEIALHDERFKMNARFLTDLAGEDELKVRASLDTRRLYGYSERDLPLYEEDSQKQTLQLGFDEAIVLLPFGRNGGDRLKIEITPARTEEAARLPSGRLRPLEINIIKPAPGGTINVRAVKQPHNFEVEMALLENGREVARGAGSFLLEEAQELVLQPDSSAGPDVAADPLAVSLTIDEFLRGRPLDQVAISFDVYRITGGARDAIARNWAGITALGEGLNYDLTDHYLKSPGRAYELRFTVKLAAGETVD